MCGEFRITKDERVMLKHCANGGKLFNTKPYALAAPMLKKGWLSDNGSDLVITKIGMIVARQLGLIEDARL